MSKVAVIGGGAAGLLASILLAEKNHQVTLFESNDKVGKKILVSGNGHCNISNQHISPSNYAGFEPAFTSFCLDKFTFNHLEKLLKKMGLFLDCKEDGKVYPMSHEAKSVVELFVMSAENLGVVIHTEVKIVDCSKEEKFILKSETDEYANFDKIVLATGSKAAPQLGGNESGYTLAQSMGHALAEPYPSLVQLELSGDAFKAMSGVKQFSEVSLLIDKKVETKLQGDVLFTNYGVSGLAILDLSQKASQALSLFSSVDIVVNLMPNFDRQKLDSKLHALCQQLPQAYLSVLLSGMIHRKIVIQIFKELSIDTLIKAEDISHKMIQKIVNLLINWKFHVEDTHGFKHAEVSGGGVLTSEIDPKTMQSLMNPDLYVIGEVLDVVGDRGGYNFHFAFASAFCMADALA